MSHHNDADAPWFMKHDIPLIVLFLARYVFPWFNYGYLHSGDNPNGRYWQWSPCTVHSVLKPGAKVGTVKPILWQSEKDK